MVTANGKRQRAIKWALQQLRARLPNADGDVLKLLAELDAASAVLFAALDGKATRDVLAAYGKLVDQRIDLLTRLRLLPTPPRPKAKEDPDLDPYVQQHLAGLRAHGEKV